MFLEKPLARTSAEAFQLVEAARSYGRTLMAGHVLRFFPAWQELARTLRTAPVKLASFRRNCSRPSWSPWLADPELSGGAPLDLLIHDADFVLHCFGQPTRISAIGLAAPSLGIDWLCAQCTFQGGNFATITGGWHASPTYPFSMEFSALTPERTYDWSSLNSPPDQADSWADQLQHFTDCARANIESVISPPVESAQAVRFVEIMVESRMHNGDPVPWTD